MKKHLSLISAAAALSLMAAYAVAGEEDEIVTGCHFSNGEWGTDAIHICINENRALREQVLAYSPEHKRIVERCRRGLELGWQWVKNCVDKDIEAAAELQKYPAQFVGLIEDCEKEIGHRGAAKVKACVDKAAETPSSRN
ncbi:MAG: hypothetical protein EXR36_04950 [Betaproteobacteria bacterium]|nr:hypothetical protein [Betaproteobacteria bacterium]